MSLDTQSFEKWAKVYDIVYGNYKDDLDFYKKEAHMTKGKALEIACGTGRVHLELLKEGIDAYGIDISRNILKALIEKARRLRLTPKVVRADMRKLLLRLVGFKKWNVYGEYNYEPLESYRQEMVWIIENEKS